mmetsp:Transcript_47349/g.110361  ORF Transcript_47349/g.110361 Transcript_47349/m.110361 type:complete len:214 (+) Transcript_47349:74-715(+)
MLSTFSTVPSSPKWSMKGRPGANFKHETPGPGAYASEVTMKRKAPEYGWGTAPREVQRPSTAPGPGKYDTHSLDTSRKHGFGTSSRKGIPYRAEQPGPGSYELEDKIGQEGPKYTMKGGRALGHSASTPGPGAYSALEARDEVKRASPKYGFGTSPREGLPLRADRPGPGSYEMDDRLGHEGPKYTLQGRKQLSRVNDTPGPGAHGPVYTQFG